MAIRLAVDFGTATLVVPVHSLVAPLPIPNPVDKIPPFSVVLIHGAPRPVSSHRFCRHRALAPSGAYAKSRREERRRMLEHRDMRYRKLS